MPRHETYADGYLSSPQSPSVFSTAKYAKPDWPNAIQHPLFYIGVYAGIGLVNVLVGISATIAQYTGALRASRVFFRYVSNHFYFDTPDLEQATLDECGTSYVPVS